MLQAYVRGFLARKRATGEKASSGLISSSVKGEASVQNIVQQRFEKTKKMKDMFLEHTLVGKNVLFEEVGTDVRIRACSEAKLVEFLFSPFYVDQDLVETLLATFEVCVYLFFFFFVYWCCLLKLKPTGYYASDQFL